MKIDHDHPRQSHIVVSSSSSSLSCQIFFHSTQQHDAGYILSSREDNNYAYNQSRSSSSSNENNSGLKLTVWKKESHEDDQKINNYPLKYWMSSKMRLLQYNPSTKLEEDHEKLVVVHGSSMETSHDQDLSSSSSSSNNVNINNNNNNNNVSCYPIRVCSDCSTTKTPLWRSGPKGPKSLCNACGIRQRKARRAMAIAAVDEPPALHMIKEIKCKINNASSFRKRFKMTSAAGSSSIGAGTPISLHNYNGPNKIEEFLIHSSNNLAAAQLRVFPEDEKDAAILLMALSSGLFHT
ncbi:hypothetical protein ACJIZ3_018782 [Penstemon smallii]|uniref:GATA-type domain-containing protein n=1 Tax=Penstemon smallii TaxID=265156 RepID=A0ABD3SZV4_9LAMI